MIRRWWLIPLALISISSVIWARQGVLKTKDGLTFTGEINEAPAGNPTSVQVTVGTSVVMVPKANVSSISYSDSVQQEFKDRMDKLGPKDIPGRIDLARWALDKKQYDLASQAADSAAKIDPTDPDVKAITAIIKSQRALDSKPAAPATPAAAPTGQKPAVTPATQSSQNPKYLTADDINRIRQVELRPDDDVRIQFTNNVKQRYLASLSIPTEFNSGTTSDQAMDIIQTNEPRLYKDVKIGSDPKALAEYKIKIEPRLLAGCATSGCHGGDPAPGGFFLYSPAVSPAAVYTNFYLLESFEKQTNSAFGHGPADVHLIDRVRPQSSMLVQYMLPENLAATPHPTVKGWRALVRSEQDAYYKDVLQWLGSTLKPMEPDYGIKFDRPKSPTTKPTSAPPKAAPAIPPPTPAAPDAIPTPPPANQ